MPGEVVNQPWIHTRGCQHGRATDRPEADGAGPDDGRPRLLYADDMMGGQYPSGWPSGRDGEDRKPWWQQDHLPLWVKIPLIVVAVIIVLVAGGKISGIDLPPFQFVFPGHSKTPSPGPSVTGTPATIGGPGRSHSAPPTRTTVGYLYTMAPTAGALVQRGVTSIGGRTFSHSIWLPFQVSCCGSEQSVTYSIPGGYRYLEASLGQSPLPGELYGYDMVFSISVNGVVVLNNQHAQFGYPPIRVKVRLPSGSASVEIDVNAACNNFTCGGIAVIGNARLIPPVTR